MTSFKPAALFTVLGLVLVGLPGWADEFKYPPGYDPNAPRAEAADQTLGMALMSATVNRDGMLLVGGGAVSSTRASAGTYDVKFVRGLDACTCTASFGSHGFASGNLAQNFISANCPYASSDNVRVWIIKQGVEADGDFQLIVFCPK